MADLVQIGPGETDLGKIVAALRAVIERFPASEDAAAAATPTTTQIISGAGLTGGGDLSADRTLAVGAGTGITVNADAVALANMAATTVKARGTASTGAPEDIAIGNGISLDATSLRTKQQMSVTADGSGLKLSGDASSPGNSKYYGTDSGGTKGFNDISAMTQVAEAAASSGTTVSFTDLPSCKMLVATYNNLSHNNGANQTLRFALSSNNGSSYNTAQNMFSTAVAAAVSGSGLLFIGRFDKASTYAFQSSFIAQILGGVETVTSGPANAIQFSWSAGSFDDAGGNITVYAIK